MEGEGRERGLDPTDERPNVRDNGGRGLRNPVIGIIGKRVINSRERAALRYIGRCAARLGHTLAFVPAKGVADAVREGAELEGGELLPLERDVIGVANHTHVYPDKRLLSRLLAVYPNLESMTNVLVIREDQLDEWVDAVNQTMKDRGVPLPT
jgi:hypothetical protein